MQTIREEDQDTAYFVSQQGRFDSLSNSDTSPEMMKQFSFGKQSSEQSKILNMPSIVFRNQVSFGQPLSLSRAEYNKYGRKIKIDDSMTLPAGQNHVEHLKASKSEIQTHFNKKTSLQSRNKAQMPIGTKQDNMRGAGEISPLQTIREERTSVYSNGDNQESLGQPLHKKTHEYSYNTNPLHNSVEQKEDKFGESSKKCFCFF